MTMVAAPRASRAPRKWTSFRERAQIALMLAPSLTIGLGLFAGGVVSGIGQSLGYTPLLPHGSATMTYYAAVLFDSSFFASLWLTCRISAVATMLSAVLAVVAALALRGALRGQRVAAFLFQMPLPIPHIVTAGGIITIFSQSGLLARVVAALGWLPGPASFPPLVFDRPGIGIILAYVWKETPFIGLILLAVLRSIGPEYEEQARTLGASAWQRFWNILLPLALPGLLSATFIVFAFVFSSYEIPLLLGVKYPAALPVLAYQDYVNADLSLRPQAMAIGVLLTISSIILLFAYRRLVRYSAGRVLG